MSKECKDDFLSVSSCLTHVFFILPFEPAEECELAPEVKGTDVDVVRNVFVSRILSVLWDPDAEGVTAVLITRSVVITCSLAFMGEGEEGAVSDGVSATIGVDLFIPFSIFFFPSGMLPLGSAYPFSLFLLVVTVFSLREGARGPVARVLLALLVGACCGECKEGLGRMFSFSAIFLFVSGYLS